MELTNKDIKKIDEDTDGYGICDACDSIECNCGDVCPAFEARA